VATAGTALAFAVRMATDQPFLLVLDVVVIGGAFGVEALLRRRTGRVVRSDASIAGGTRRPRERQGR
jgi:hypothetical protein